MFRIWPLLSAVSLTLLVHPPSAEASGYWVPIIATDGGETFVVTDDQGEALILNAQTLCEDVAEVGDHVLLTQDPQACIFNTFFNPRTERTCDLWCD